MATCLAAFLWGGGEREKTRIFLTSKKKSGKFSVLKPKTNTRERERELEICKVPA